MKLPKKTAAAVFLTGLIAAALCLGDRIYSPHEMLTILTGGGGTDYDILLKLRIPRLLMGLLAGASLSVSGCVFQALFRNPLAEPYMLGVSGGAAVGSAAAIALSLPFAAVVLFAFAGSTAVVLIIFVFSARLSFGSARLILAGIALGFMCTSAVMIIYAFSGPGSVHRAVMWLMGDLSMARYEILAAGSALSAILFFIIAVHHRHLDIISFGDRFASGLGISAGTERSLFMAASGLAAVTVALAGVIGFVGLIVPHIIRMVYGPAHRLLLPLSAAAGGVFLVIADAAGRSVLPPYEIPSGIITGLAGGAFFLIYTLQGRGVD